MGPRNKACRKRPKLGELKAPDWPGLPGPCALQGASAHRCKACEDPTGADKGREKLRRSFVEGPASAVATLSDRHGALVMSRPEFCPKRDRMAKRPPCPPCPPLLPTTRRVEPTERRTVKCQSLLLSLLLLRAPFSHQVWPTAGRHLAKSRIAMGSARLQVFWKGHGRLHRAKPTPSPPRAVRSGAGPPVPQRQGSGRLFHAPAISATAAAQPDGRSSVASLLKHDGFNLASLYQSRAKAPHLPRAVRVCVRWLGCRCRCIVLFLAADRKHGALVAARARAPRQGGRICQSTG